MVCYDLIHIYEGSSDGHKRLKQQQPNVEYHMNESGSADSTAGSSEAGSAGNPSNVGNRNEDKNAT